MTKYIRHNLNDDPKTVEDIVKIVTTQIGEVDGCMTVWDSNVPLTALLCEQFNKAGIPSQGALAAKQKGQIYDVLREFDRNQTKQSCKEW